MKQPGIKQAMASREWGLRRVRQLTWAIGGAGAIGAIAMVVGFSGHAHPPRPGQPAQGGKASAGSQGQTGSQQPQNQARSDGQLQPPVANPVPAQGPGHVVSGGS